MAENQDGQEKSQEPTARRLDEARKKGQIPRSRELNTMAVTLAGLAVVFAMSGTLGRQFGDILTHNFSLERSVTRDPAAVLQHLEASLLDALLLLAPVLAITVVVAIVASVALGGINFSSEALALKLEKLNPIQGMKRVFSLRGLMEMLKSLAKFLLVAGTTTLLLWSWRGDFIALGDMELQRAAAHMASLLGWAALLVASTLVLMALIDVPFQLWDHRRQLKMTQQEVRDELKDTEGKPEVRSRIRQLQRELAQRRMMEEVPKADVIVTNPTHFAVALRYDQTRMRAPVVVAKGSELVAANIRRVGEEHRVTIVEAPPLARALYFSVDIGDPIPAALYLAVAKLLAYVFQLRVYRTDGGTPPSQPEFPIPEDLRRDKKSRAEGQGPRA